MSEGMAGTPRAQARVDLAALAGNVAAMGRRASGAQVMAVVKADAYGHGLVPCARAAQQGGASWLGTALLAEAIQLREQGLAGPILAWLWAPAEPQLAQAVAAEIDVAAYAAWAIEALAAAGRQTGRRPRVHLKVDTGLLRGGATDATAVGVTHSSETGWELLLQAAAVAQRRNEIEVVGVFSHLASGEVPGPNHEQGGELTAQQLHRFTTACEQARAHGIEAQVRHLANSGAIFTAPDTHLDVVRAGIACYGLMPDPALGTPQEHGLQPVMTLSAQVTLSKQVAAQQGVSYGHTYRTSAATTLCVVPLGYADGIARAASNRAEMWVGGRRHRIAGRVCMDQVVLDVGDYPAHAGEPVVVFGPGTQGEPTVADWALWCDTISYEITTRLGPRVLRTYPQG